ncbi:23S rRNA (uracil(1939)-C(5))-methyltransferase RlmD [Clostridium sp. HMP27]|uniref:23S rRNA (uracil(1939)-C(5))-methyltransferase RlmD n=1 Tax=Clostridium sp. HMP27 TaxID=1487921 RepID=UPI00052BFCBC|nr:23S rRNA (uracil(1939)-C(5))-methyltransferase RlmD [Clostridium sp. HMP27]KGK87336.1 RNA methyltransferase [Clostridium sp. HMP27]
MKRVIPVEKNKDYIVEIKGMGYEGEGVGKIDDFTIFIPGAIKGEKVNAKIVKVNKNFAFGKLLDVVEESSFRTEPICGIYKRCGGCQLQHLSYEGQLDFKGQRVKDAIERIGKINPEVLPVIGMENPYNYRNKVQLPVGEANGEINIGFYALRSHDIINMEKCYIQDEISEKIMTLVKQWMITNNIKAYDETTHTGVLRHLMIRKGFKTSEVMVVLVTRTNELPHKDEIINLLTSNVKEVVSVIQNINSEKTNVILGLKSNTLWGKDTIQDYIGKFKFNISPLSFFQVNPIQTEVLYNKALEYASLTGDEIVFDAYCGTGTISLFLAQKAKKVYGVEIIPEAIENAWENAKLNNVDNVDFLVGKSEQVIPDLINKGIKADVVVVDPPRKGCERVLLEAIAKINPKRIVYVSCDAGTLARDLAILDELNYKTEKIQPVDMFPHTAHVESVVLITRKEK